MKKRFLLSITIIAVVMAVGVAYATVSFQNNCFINANLEALSSQEASGKRQCYIQDNFGNIMLYNGVLCPLDDLGHCYYPHSYKVRDALVDCVHVN